MQVGGQAGAVKVGALTLSDFVTPAGLQSKGGNLYVETGASGPAQSGAPGQSGLGVLVQGSPEDYDEWGPEWRYESFEPYLRRAEAGESDLDQIGEAMGLTGERVRQIQGEAFARVSERRAALRGLL